MGWQLIFLFTYKGLFERCMIFKMYVSTNLCSLFDYLYWPLWPVLGIVVQLVTTMLLQGGSCGFEPRQSQLIQWFESFPLVCLTFTLSQLILFYFRINLHNSFLSWEGNVFLLTDFFFNAECVCEYVLFVALWCGMSYCVSYICIIKYTIAKIQIVIGFPLKM